MPVSRDNMIPVLYHLHHSRHMEDLPFWLELAERQGGPVLELGCGTGRITTHLASAGYLTYGLDNQAEMLSYLQQNLPPELRPNIRLIQADMSAFRLVARFPLVLLPCNTLGSLSKQTRLNTLGCVAQQMGEDSLFTASLPNPAILTRLPEQVDSEVEDVFPHPVDGEPVQISSSWERRPERLIIKWHYDHLLADGHVHRVTIETSHNLSPVEVYLQEMKAAGLRVSATYGDFDRSPYSSSSPFLILAAGRLAPA